MKKSIRTLVLATSVAVLASSSLFAAVTGSDPAPKLPKGPKSSIVLVILTILGY